MHLKLKKIPVKPFIIIFSSINIIAGFILGIVVTIASLAAPEEQGAGVGVWAVILFPLLNGVLGVATGAFFAGLYNFLANRFGGIELEFEEAEKS